MSKKFIGLIALSLMLALLLVACGDSEEGADDQTETENNNDAAEEEGEPIKIGVLVSLSGALEAYGVQTQRGFELGLDYVTDGTREFNGRPIEVIYEDTETSPDVARQKALKLLEDDEVDFLVGSSSSGDTLAVTPLAEEYETIMVVEPAVADSITGSEYNDYIFRTGRNSSQDAVAGAAAIADEGVTIATLAPDYAFGHDGIAAFKPVAEELGAEIVLEEYAPQDATDFTPHVQKIIEADPDYLFVVWSGANSPWNAIVDMGVQDKGIKISTGAPDIAALKTMNDLVGMEGFTVYHHTLPDNEVNDWLVEEHTARYDGDLPDLFTPGGMSASMAIVEALEQSNGSTDANELIDVMEGMSFNSPKGTMTFREEDHQALQALYAVELVEKDGFDYPVPKLIRVLEPEETEPPIMND
ncbi:substrate-binding domain-containing protein [Tenuibacillus multivorans]|uniref:Branched-chain amino acid transport system substrate-binding protein n=1 Tax=Tenuibacillus multivorans TaxID=237069 RepID=A0A1H0G2M7_9BACI|nr:substrate-binding domain-containing protein [Tenuibacillus multivorans]GEL78107.1 ABC transporter permease [Tenuibacillus multivorans]SDO01094.1 branched-chain amino acid transport system substrate-binding protein [Tenuibacillus multivorans]